MAFGIHYNPSTNRVLRVYRGGAGIVTGPGVLRVDKYNLDSSGLSALLDEAHYPTSDPRTWSCDGSTVAVAAETLAEAQAWMVPAINAETGRRIGLGYDHRGLKFSLSQQAQSNLHGAAHRGGRLPYPLRVYNCDDSAYLDILNQQELGEMIDAAFDYVASCRGAGTLARAQVLGATTLADAYAAYNAYMGA